MPKSVAEKRGQSQLKQENSTLFYGNIFILRPVLDFDG